MFVSRPVLGYIHIDINTSTSSGFFAAYTIFTRRDGVFMVTCTSIAQCVLKISSEIISSEFFANKTFNNILLILRLTLVSV